MNWFYNLRLRVGTWRRHRQSQTNLSMNSWMPKETWDAMVAGDNPLVRYANAPLGEVVSDAYGYTVADFEASRLQLKRNQYVRGYCVLVAKTPARELHELPPVECAQFLDEMVQVGTALENVFSPIKINYEILGNAIPHVHAHIKPRYYGDPAPGSPIWADERIVMLNDNEYQEIVGNLRQALGLSRSLLH